MPRSHAGVKAMTNLDDLVAALERDGELHVASLDGESTYRLAVLTDGDPMSLSWFDATRPVGPVLWSFSPQFEVESRQEWRERCARAFIFAVLGGVDLRDRTDQP